MTIKHGDWLKAATLEAAWKAIEKRSVPSDASDVQRADMKLAFWSGLAAMFARTTSILSEAESEEDEMEQFGRIDDELRAMVRKIGALDDSSVQQPLKGRDGFEARIMAIDPVTGEETLATPEQARAVIADMREALLHEEKRIVFSDEAVAQLRARGKTEDEIKSMLADHFGVKQ